MKAIEVRLNGELKATCGADQVRHLVAMLSARRERSDPDNLQFVVECSGVRPTSEETEEVLKWLSAKVSLGDEVSFRVVESSQVNQPIDRQSIAKSKGK